MSGHLLLQPGPAAAIRDYYQRTHRHWRAIPALLITAGWLLLWCVLRLEAPAWCWLRQNRRQLYPQLQRSYRFADPLRLLLQTLWLLLRGARSARPAATLRLSAASAHLFALLRRGRQRLYHTLNTFPFHTHPWVQPMTQTGPWHQARSKLAALWQWGILALALVLAILCITEPFGMLAQLTFVVILWVLALLIRNVPGRFPSMMMIVLSVVISCRYLWWRYTQTLNWDSPLDLSFG
ncbi:MAG: UDP-forming cellulose synthase catalytic subunit, partial [Plesiomonas sp.]